MEILEIGTDEEFQEWLDAGEIEFQREEKARRKEARKPVRPRRDPVVQNLHDVEKAEYEYQVRLFKWAISE